MPDQIRNGNGKFIHGHPALNPRGVKGNFISANSLEYLGIQLKEYINKTKDVPVETEHDKAYMKGRMSAFDFVFKLIEKVNE